MASRQVLDSWKEISAYLNRSVMTCQRWERQLDLPVHRLDGTPKARVFAYPDELDRWLAEKLHVAEPTEESRHPSSRRRARSALVTTASIAIVGALGAAGWRLFIQPPVPTPAQVPSLAILPFENRTGDPAWDDWRLALPDLLTIDLRQSKFLDVIKTSATYQAVGALAEAEKFSADELRKVAEKAGVGYAVTGAIHKPGDDIVLTAFVYNAGTGDLLGSPRVTCRTEKDIFSGTDDLSREVKISLNVRPRDIRRDIDRPVAGITTSSPQAFKLYSESYRGQGRGEGGAGKFDEAVAPLKKAVKLDPDFGLAYRMLHYACRALSRSEDARAYGEMAVRMADRICERERRPFLTDWYGSERLDRKRRIGEYEKLGKKYPYDLTMTGLALEYIELEEWGKAIPVLEKLLLRYPGRLNQITRLSDCYRSLGRYREAQKIIDERLGPDPQPGRDTNALLGSRYRLALTQGKFDIAHECAERMKAGDPDIASYFSNKGFIYFMEDDLANAEKMYIRMLDGDNMRTQMHGYEYLAAVSLSRGRIEESKQRILRALETLKGLEDYGAPQEKPYRHFLAYLERLSGRLPEAWREIELAYGDAGLKGLVQVVPVIHLRALLMLETGRDGEFDKFVEEFRRYLDPDRFPFGSPKHIRAYYHLLGHRELRKKNYDPAVQLFWKAADLVSPLAAQTIDGEKAKYYYDLAEAYRLGGSLPDAVKMYEKVILPTVSREFSGDLYAKSYYWLGVNAEQWMRSSSNPELAGERCLKAIGYYRKFLDLWRDADPIFPEVEDARQRLSRLEAQ